MKNPERVAELLAELRELADNDFERHRINILERDLTAPPIVEQVDDNHQKFNGLTFRKTSDGHFVSSNQPIHRAVWIYYHGVINNDFVIHHIDENPANNTIDNLQCLTFDEHNKLHNLNRRGTRLKKKVFVCEHCNKTYEGFAAGVNRFCSPQCRQQHYGQQKRTIVKHCLFCGKDFATRHSDAKFCSYSCAAKATRQKYSNKEKRICPICGKEFETTPSADHKTCSRSCGSKLMHQKRRQN